MSTEKLQMSAVGVPNGWTLAAGASKMAAVAEPHDAAVSFINSGVVAETIQELLAVNTTGAIAADALISSVKIHARCRRGAAEIADANFLLTAVLGVNSSDGAAHTAQVAFADFSDTFAAKPGGGAWTKADVDALKVRIRNTEAQDVDCTTLYVEVTFTAFAGTARGLVTITTQLGVEVNPGTPVAADRYIQCLSLMPKLVKESQPFRPRGSKYPTQNVPHKTWGQGAYEGIGCYNALAYVLSGLLPDPAPTQIGATAAYRRLYQPLSRQGDDTKLTYTMETGSAIEVRRFAYGQIASMLLALTQDDVKVSGNLFAQKPAFNQVQTPDPDIIVGRPIQRGQIDVFFDLLFADIGTTQLTDVAQEQLQLGDKWKPVWAHNTNSPSFRNVVEVAPDCVFSFINPSNTQGRAYLDLLDDGETHYLRIQAIGDVIADNAGTPVNESLIIDIAGQFDAAEDTDEQDTYADQFTFRALDDPDLGGPFTVELINLLETL